MAATRSSPRSKRLGYAKVSQLGPTQFVVEIESIQR